MVGTPSTAKVSLAVPFFMVTSMEASLRFYADGLGFQMTEKWELDGQIKWCWLQRDSVALMLQEWAPDRRPPPDTKPGVGVSIAFVCDDAVAIYRECKARGIEAGTPFVGNSMWVTSLTDPDGYRMDFESKTDAPEESTLEE
jgi:catechol 2,3-dioxygenase-like lactoylglutathione lyase family enzyme